MLVLFFNISIFVAIQYLHQKILKFPKKKKKAAAQTVYPGWLYSSICKKEENK